jgi:hypothetical protein
MGYKNMKTYKGHIGAPVTVIPMGTIPEKTIEHHLTTTAKQAGGLALKLVSPGFDGMPDRIVLLPGGRIGFVEVKRDGQKPRPLQLSRHRLLRRLGFQVFVLDHCEQIGVIIREIQAA